MIIDISNEIFTVLKTNITAAKILLSYSSTSPTFPCITFEELTNNIDVSTVDTSGEHYNMIALEINIFTNGETQVSDAKTLRTSVDNILSGTYRMSRDFSSPTPNYQDANIYKYTMRYSFKIDKNKTIYRGN